MSIVSLIAAEPIKSPIIYIRCISLLCYQCVKKLKNLHCGSIFFLKRLAWYLKKPYLCIRFRERSSLGAIEKEFIERFT